MDKETKVKILRAARAELMNTVWIHSRRRLLQKAAEELLLQDARTVAKYLGR